MFQLTMVDSWYKLCMRGSSERNRGSFPDVQPSTLSTYHGFKSTNNAMQYFYSLTQHKLLTENAAVHQLKTMTSQTVILVHAALGGLMDFGKINKKLFSMHVLFK